MAPLPRPTHCARLTHHLRLSSTTAHPLHASHALPTSTSTLRLASRPSPHPLYPNPTPNQTYRTFTTTPPAHSSSHDSPYEPPTGNLWGVPAGETYKKEGWETIWMIGFWGSLLVGGVGYAFKPDTSIETWALEEAKRRLQIEGIIPEDGEEYTR